MIHHITDEQLLAIEQSLGMVTPKDLRIGDRLERIIAEASLIRSKASLVTSADVPEFKPATKWEYIKNKLALFFNKR